MPLLNPELSSHHHPSEKDILQEHKSFLTKPHVWYRHPWLRLFILFMVLFMDFFTYGEDPSQESRVHATSIGTGQVAGIVAFWYAPSFVHGLLKFVLLIASMLLAYVFGKGIVVFMDKAIKIHAFRSDGGLVCSTIIGWAAACFIVDAIYNKVVFELLPLSAQDQPKGYDVDLHSMEFFTTVFGLKSPRYNDMGKMWQWLSATLDWLSIFQIGDCIFTDRLYYKDWCKGFKDWYTSRDGCIRKWIHRIGFPLMVVLTATLLHMVGDRKGAFEIPFFAGHNEATRSLFASFIIFLDLFCLGQDWEFPLFNEEHNDEEHHNKIAGTDQTTVNIGCGKRKLRISAKWIQYGPLIGIMGADFAFVKSMFGYTPQAYGQYVHPNTSKIWSITDTALLDEIYPLGTNANKTLLSQVTWVARHYANGSLRPCCVNDTESTAKFMDQKLDIFGIMKFPTDYFGLIIGVSLLVGFLYIARRAHDTAIKEHVSVWGEEPDEEANSDKVLAREPKDVPLAAQRFGE